MAGRSGPAPTQSRFVYVPAFTVPGGGTAVVCELARISVLSEGPTLDVNAKIIAVGPGDDVLATPNCSSSLIDISYRVRDGVLAPVTANVASKTFSGAAGTFAAEVSFVAVQLQLTNDGTAGVDLVASNGDVVDLTANLTVRYSFTPGNP